MKRVVSVSLGSSKRDHWTEETFNGQLVRIERRGTDGSVKQAISLLKELDGKVDAFGLGGTDLYIYAGGRRYAFRESMKIAAAARLTPIVDGSGVKNTLERTVVAHLRDQYGLSLQTRKVLLVCAVDRFGLAEALFQAGCRLTCGDLMFGLGLPLPIRSPEGLRRRRLPNCREAGFTLPAASKCRLRPASAAIFRRPTLLPETFILFIAICRRSFPGRL